TVLSNGFSALAPWRIELYSCPPPDNIPQDWQRHLLVHELRHSVQLNHLNQGLTRVNRFLFGEAGWGISAAGLPLWYLEGDAVYTETNLLGTGRGSTASFLKGFKAITLEPPGPYTYQKAYFGSFKDFVPDHYQLGYYMVSHVNRIMGKTPGIRWLGTWENIPFP
ncbi:MAG: hypothetical protein HC896_16525, partial [Bacteroidales bacterium]|nr:hypothetical protein [Bacteroidales bacterium]